MQTPAHINARLQAKLDYWRVKPPSATPLPFGGLSGDHRSPIDTAGLWSYESYEAILYGMDFLREECDQWFGVDRKPPPVLRHVIDKLRAAPHKLPPHDAWLQQVLGMRRYPAA